MQSTNKELYKMTSERTGVSEQVYKDVGTMIFTELSACLKRPKSLIIKLKGIGFWYLRKARIEAIVNKEFSEELSLFRHENREEIYNLFKERLVEYEEYIKEKKAVKQKRNETQVLLQPPKRED